MSQGTESGARRLADDPWLGVWCFVPAVAVVAARLPMRISDLLSVSSFAGRVLVSAVVAAAAVGLGRTLRQYAEHRRPLRLGHEAFMFATTTLIIAVGGGLLVAAMGAWPFAWVAVSLALSGLQTVAERMPGRARSLEPVGGELASKLDELRGDLAPTRDVAFCWSTDPRVRRTACAQWTFGRSRIVLGQGLAELPTEQVVAIAAHELGHLEMRHPLIRSTVGAVFDIFDLAVLLAVMQPAVLQWFGLSGTGDPHTVALLVALALSPLSQVGDAIYTPVVRAQELAADRYAARAVGPAVVEASLRALYAGLPTTSGALRRLTAHHPPLASRLAALGALSPI